MKEQGSGERDADFLDPGPEGERIIVNSKGEVMLIKKSAHGVTRSPLLSVGESRFDGSLELR